MRNYKKYRTTVLFLFQSFLAGKINKYQLINDLKVIEDDLRQNRATLKELWFKFFQNDTLATNITDIFNYCGSPSIDTLYEERMQIAIDNPKGLQIYYS